MSWLFDRLCEIAVADQVDVVAAAGLSPPESGDASDWNEVLLRASSVPQLMVTTLPAWAPPNAALGPQVYSVDLSEVPLGDGADVIAGLVHDAATRGHAVVVRGEHVGVRRVGRETRPLLPDQGRRLVVATDLPGQRTVFEDLGRLGLGIAVGGVDPGAHVHVSSFPGVTSIVDALVTLRMFAFGGDREREALMGGSGSAGWFEPPEVLRRVGRQPSPSSASPM